MNKYILNKLFAFCLALSLPTAFMTSSRQTMGTKEVEIAIPLGNMPLLFRPWRRSPLAE